MKKLVFILMCVSSLSVWAADGFVSFVQPSTPALQLTGTTAAVTWDEADYPGVLIAAKNLQADLQAVTGSINAPVVVGTWGKSKLIDSKAYAKELKGKNARFMACMNCRDSWVYHHGIGGQTCLCRNIVRFLPDRDNIQMGNLP